jgi:FMN phosphatase YigB (HAD superfamily)
MLKVVLDYDGTLTAEERQVPEVTRRSLLELADQILHVPLEELEAAYAATVARLQAAPHEYHWEVNGVRVSYCDEGAFILNTVALQTMLADNQLYSEAVAAHFADAEYDPVAVCTNHLFHAHTAPLEVPFRKATFEVLRWLVAHSEVEPVVLTNSLGDKVERNLRRLDLDPIRVLGDTRQYDLDPDWTPPFEGNAQFLMVDDLHTVDLRRHIYHDALTHELADGSSLAIVADTLSLPGALPLAMGLPFALLRTRYTPGWCVTYVKQHPLGIVLDDLTALPAWTERLLLESTR